MHPVSATHSAESSAIFDRWLNWLVRFFWVRRAISAVRPRHQPSSISESAQPITSYEPAQKERFIQEPNIAKRHSRGVSCRRPHTTHDVKHKFHFQTFKLKSDFCFEIVVKYGRTIARRRGRVCQIQAWRSFGYEPRVSSPHQKKSDCKGWLRQRCKTGQRETEAQTHHYPSLPKKAWPTDVPPTSTV